MPVANDFPRSAGILLPVSSLPSPYGIGTLGAAAYAFVSFLRDAGQSHWQVLPVGPTSYGDSPYQSFSAFAGNPYYIDLDILCDEGLLSRSQIAAVEWSADESRVDYGLLYDLRFDILRQACAAYSTSPTRAAQEGDFAAFCEENADWLEDYCLFMALKNHFGGVEWQRWDDPIRTRQPQAVRHYTELLKDEMGFWRFVQFKFFAQWNALRAFAHSNGVTIIGDIPIYVAMDSADVWANTDQFWMDDDKRPVKVAGVPPDYFSKSGQLWGNPLYRWDAMKADGFRWWRRRIGFCAGMYDVIRIDHFIGVVRYYAISADAQTAVSGEWLPGPGMDLIDAINEARMDTLMIAEDLGEVAPQVRRVQKRSGYPGMKVLQFAFDGSMDNPFLPHNCERNYVVYTGTHDNDTTQGFISTMSRKDRRFAMDYLGVRYSRDLCLAMIRAALSSVAHTAIIPLYDWLGLESQARINIPSTIGGNWTWRVSADMLSGKLSARILAMTKLYGRKTEYERGQSKRAVL